MTAEAVPARERDPRLRLLVGLFAVLVAMTQVGSIMAPTLVKRSPELLLLLSSRIRHLLFAVPAGIHPIAYSIIGMARLSAAAALCYLLGRDYGERGVAWLERQLGGETPATFRWLQLGVERAAPLLVFVMPGSNIVCVLVGLRRMPARRFAVSLIGGIAFRLAWVWIAAKRFESQLTSALDWITAHQWWLVAAFMGLSIVQSAVRTAPAAASSGSAERRLTTIAWSLDRRARLRRMGPGAAWVAAHRTGTPQRCSSCAARPDAGAPGAEPLGSFPLPVVRSRSGAPPP